MCAFVALRLVFPFQANLCLYYLYPACLTAGGLKALKELQVDCKQMQERDLASGKSREWDFYDTKIFLSDI